MKIARTVLMIAALLCCALPSFAVNAFMAFDVTHQKMYVVVQNDERDDLIADVTFGQEDSSGYIGDTCMIEQPEPNQLIANVCMGPISGSNRAVDDGHENVIVAHITLYNAPDRSDRTDEIIVRDTLVAHVNPYTSEGYYTYRAETGCTPVMPANIPIGSAFCAWVCHGSYSIPIVCEDPGYDPDMLEVYVANGCTPSATNHCNLSCPQITWSVFNWYKRVLPGCRLYLVMTYCLAEPGCVCIWRSDFFLPVEVLGFGQVAGDHRVRLNWSTASETNVDNFIIARSTIRDGIYETVHSENALNGAAGHNYTWTDVTVENGQTYYYKLVVSDADGEHVYNVNNVPVILEATPRAGAEVPMEYSLSQNFPNPFNSQTSFTFAIPEAGHTTLKVFDLLGREVATLMDKDLAVNTYTVSWSANGLPTGVYMYTLTSGEFSQTKKMLYLK